MLKWTVGHRDSGSNGGGGCCRAALKLSRRNNKDKENSSCPQSQTQGQPHSVPIQNEDGEGQIGTRDSVYMRLDSIPVALRDVSNHPQTSTPHQRIRRRSTGERLRKSPCRSGNVHANRSNSTMKRKLNCNFHETNENHQRFSLENVFQDGTPICSTAARKQPCTGAHHPIGGVCLLAAPSQSCSALYNKEHLQAEIEYSPCPLRTAQSLIALRKQVCLDNPLYFALADSPTPSPVELVNKELPASETPLTRAFQFQSKESILRRCNLSGTPDLKTTSEVSPLARRLAFLRVNCGNMSSTRNNCSIVENNNNNNNNNNNHNNNVVTPAVVTLHNNNVVHSSTAICSSKDKPCKTNMIHPTAQPLINHEITDPRFLDGTLMNNRILQNNNETNLENVMNKLKESDKIDTLNLKTHHMCDKLPKSSDSNSIFYSKLEEWKNTRGSCKSLPYTNNDRNNQSTNCSNSNSISKNQSFIRNDENLLKSTLENEDNKLKERLDQKVSNSNNDLCRKRRGVVFDEKTFDLNTPTESESGERRSSSYATSIELDAPSTLKRQRVIRRRRNQNRNFLRESTLRSKNRIPHLISCLTLPEGIPSPFQADESFMEGIKLSNKNSSSKDIEDVDLLKTERSLVGLTLPKGIPSPPSPKISKYEDIPGIKPLDNSSLPINQKQATEKRKADDGNHSDNSEETWNSHQMHFLKTPRLSECHVLKNASLSIQSSTSKNDNEEEDEGLSSLASSDIGQSPLALVEKRSRSRRCLRFASPLDNGRKQTRLTQSLRRFREKGELDLAIHCNNRIMTIHIIRGRNLLRPSGGETCNAYVKVCLIPSASERTFHRTCVRKDSTNPRFDHKFSIELQDDDLDKRILVSAWHRDRGKRRSEFLGCMTFAVKNAIKKDISGSFQLLSQNSGRTQHVLTNTASSEQGNEPTAVMANQSDSSVEELVSIEESDIPPTPDQAQERRKSSTKKTLDKTTNEDNIFLKHLELDPPVDNVQGKGATSLSKGGRTPFTTTRKLSRQPGTSFGFSIAWTHPPRVERVESALPADQAGLRPGDYVIFVDKTNVVTLQEEEILKLIKACGNQLVLEVYRKSSANGVVGRGSLAAVGLPNQPHRSSTACSATTTGTASVELSRRKLHLPQVTFTSEGVPENMGEARKRAIYQLLNVEQQYALCLQFGISRFLLPLSERRDIISPHDHSVLFQNAQELLRLTEDVLEMLIQEEGENFGNSLGRIYFRKMAALNTAYRRYCIGLKKADCLLVEKTRDSTFMRLLTEPPIPRRRPDLTTFLHKPLEHYRDILKLLQTIHNSTLSKDDDYPAITRVVQEFQATYRDVTVESGLMEPEGEGRPLLSLQDLESRLVFTRCKPFVLSSPGRQWIFGGDLSRVEGRSVRPFWALLFTDLLLFAKVSRDRVLFVTEEPLSLLTVSQALFSIRKKATEFRLLVSSTPPGVDSPAPGGCGPLPELPLSRTPRKNSRRRTVALRAPTPELKAVWQNLIQRQIIYLNTGRGGTPASSPLDSPDPLTADSVATLDSISLKRQTPVVESRVSSGLDELIDHRCRQLGKSGASKGSALHLAQWMKGQLGAGPTGPLSPEVEPEPEVWSPEALRRRAEQLHSSPRNVSRCEEFEMSDHERSQSRCSTSDSQMTVRSTSGNSEKPLGVCRQCHKTCLVSNNNNSSQQIQHHQSEDDHHDQHSPQRHQNQLVHQQETHHYDERVQKTDQQTQKEEKTTEIDVNANPTTEFVDDNWGPLSFLTSVLSPYDPFSPVPVPHISVLPPSPPTTLRSSNNNNFWEDADLSNATDATTPIVEDQNNKLFLREESKETEEGDESDGEVEEPPYQSLSPCGLKRYGTVSSLEKLDEDSDGDETGKEQEDLPSDTSGQLGSVSQSIRGWTARAGSFVAEKMALFERLGEDTGASSFIDRYLRTMPDAIRSEELAATSTTLAGEDECETSGGTSGEEVWGTPTSGDSELASPTEHSADSIGTAQDDAREQLMMEELLGSVATPTIVPPTPGVGSRGFPQRRRLEPLVEDEEDTTESSSPDVSECTRSYSTDQGNRSDSCVTRARATTTNHGFFNKLRLRRSHSADSRHSRSTRLLKFLRSTKSEEQTSSSSSSSRLMRIFSRDSTDDIPTTIPLKAQPPQFTTAVVQPHQPQPQPQQQSTQRQHDKTLERRFWKQLRRRRSTNSVTSKSAISAT